MSQIKYPWFIRVFPNSRYKEFNSEESFEDFIKEDLPNRKIPGQYSFHKYSRLKNIGIGTLVLFRYLDKIKGIATVGSEAVHSIKTSDAGKYEGYIILRDIRLLPRPLMIEELEDLTGISFHQKGRNYSTGGRVYQKIPESQIKNVVDRLNEILDHGAQNDGEQRTDHENQGFSNADPELGRMGEEFILSLETNMLKKSDKHPEKVRDGKGYDIRSWDENGREIHIEVKTTTGDLADRIFWTRNEHFKSKNDPNYWIYRVYEFDKNAKKGKVKKIKGSFIDSFDVHPSSFYGSYDHVRSKKRSNFN